MQSSRASGPVVVLGGYGVFGRQVCRSLARRGVPLVVVGRDADRAEAFARTLGREHRSAAGDATRPGSLARILVEGGVAVCAAGPFSRIGDDWLDACVTAGCHSVDIADDRAYVARARRHHAALVARGLTAVVGASSLPGLSGALAQLAREGRPNDPEAARVTLFIGNDNPKGDAAVEAATALIGRPIPAPQGLLRGFGDRELVDLPAPFGRRAVYTFESPDYDLLPGAIGARSVRVKVGFELQLATATFALLARLRLGGRHRLGRALRAAGEIARPVGCSGGTVLVELFWTDGTVRRASLHAAENGQRMAALPAALAAIGLQRGEVTTRGTLMAYEALGARALVEAVVADGFVLGS